MACLLFLRHYSVVVCSNITISRKPYIKFQEYWLLVQSKPDGPPEIYNCTYLVDWINTAADRYSGPIENARLLFRTKQQEWDGSMSCQAFIPYFSELLERARGISRVTKIVCFGLGDFTRRPPPWWKAQNEALPEDQRSAETSIVEGALVHHAIALTMAKLARLRTNVGDEEIQLLTQDPSYSEETKDILKEIGFEVVGGHGAGGFAEIDSETIVFSPFTKAPVRQLIADLARPVAIIISPRDTIDGVWNPRGYIFQPSTTLS